MRVNDAQALTNGVGLVLKDDATSTNALNGLRLGSVRGAIGIATLFVLSASGYAALFMALHHFLHGQI